MIARLLVSIAAAVLLTAAPPAPTTSTSVVDLGAPRSGETVIDEACGFIPQSPVSVVLDDAVLATITTGTDGCVSAAVNLLSCRPPRAAVRSAETGIRRGINRVSITGFAGPGEPLRHQASFRLVCPAAKKPFNWAPVALVLAGVLIILLLGVSAEYRNRRRSMYA